MWVVNYLPPEFLAVSAAAFNSILLPFSYARLPCYVL